MLVSTSPDGRGLSATVTLPKGSVDNEGHLIADLGSIAVQAQTINQNGLVQANSVKDVNGTIELVASESLTLGANSVISAQGDSTVTTPSSGGSVQLQSGNSFSDQAGSAINVSGGSQGGNGGQIAISAPQMSALNTALNGQAAAGYAGGTLSINTEDIALNSDGSPVAGTLALNAINFGSGFSQISLQAADNIELSSHLTLTPESGIFGSLSLVAGNSITLDAGSEIEADAGRIGLNASTVSLDGTLQANSIGSINGAIGIAASESLTLGANSVISAQGDSTATSGSPGGFVVLHAGDSFSDASGSKINVSGGTGAAAGPDGFVEIFGNNVADATTVNSTIDGVSAGTFSLQNHLFINPNNLTLSTGATSDSASSPNLSLNDLLNYSQVYLYNIELASVWNPGNANAPATLNLTAMNSIVLDNGSGIAGGNNWTVNMMAGTSLPYGIPSFSSDSGVFDHGVYLNGSAYVQTQDGDINVWAANTVQIDHTDPITDAGNGIRTLNGGNIDVTAQYGDVNTGANPAGFNYSGNVVSYYNGKPLYYSPSTTLGGISTAAGGNVTISAGGDIISDVPDTTSTADAGTGAFGPEAGNVTITAGGSVYGHYVLANGVGTITAGRNVGDPGGGLETFALSLIDGSWNVNAPNGNIYLQEVRNPNGVFNNLAGGTRKNPSTVAVHYFDYGQLDSVDLNAGIGVYLTDLAVPRPDGAVPVLYPPILNITAGAGGVTIQDNVTLFPSPDQNLAITTTDGGSLVSAPNTPGAVPELLMSDSAQTQWQPGKETFSDTDHGSLAAEPNASDSDPVAINISGSLENLTLITTKATQITVGGDMIDCGFSGQNLQASDVTSINVAGQIYNQSAYTYVDGVPVPGVPFADLPSGLGNTWDDIFYLALDPAKLASLTVPSNIPLSQQADYIIQGVSLFGANYNAKQNQWVVVGGDQGFFYNPATGRLDYAGPMPQNLVSVFSQPVAILHLVNGLPVMDTNPTDDSPGRTYGQYEYDTVSLATPGQIQYLATTSLADPSPTSGQLGYRIGGPGQFDIDAGSISLGNTYGILSCGVYDTLGGFVRYNNLASITPLGAMVNVIVSGNLDMLTSTIATLGGGDVDVTSTGGSMDLGTEELFNTTRQVGFGVFSSGSGNVTVTALGNININGSRVATYDGGNIFVESMEGNVDAGTGGETLTGVALNYVNPITGTAAQYLETDFGNGILAYTLEPGLVEFGYPPADFPVSQVPGDITVLAPRGNISASLGGILQEALDGSITAGPTINLVAGTLATPASGTPGQPGYSPGSPGYTGNIDLGNSGVIGGTVNLTANGNITGLVISRQNSTINAAQSFSGTLLSGGSANLTAGGTVSGTIIGVTSANVSGGGGITASVLSQNVNVQGQKADTLGSSANATSSSQSAANQANSQAQQVANNDTSPVDDNKNKKRPQIRRVSRVTVILSAAPL